MEVVQVVRCGRDGERLVWGVAIRALSPARGLGTPGRPDEAVLRATEVDGTERFEEEANVILIADRVVDELDNVEISGRVLPFARRAD